MSDTVLDGMEDDPADDIECEFEPYCTTHDEPYPCKYDGPALIVTEVDN